MVTPSKPKGIDFIQTDIKQSLKKNYPLMLMLDFSIKCNLNCNYCFNSANEHIKAENELNYQNYIDIITQARNIGIKTIFIPGAGEPTIDKNFWRILPLINKYDMIPLVFTNGLKLDKEKIKILYNNNATVGIKLNTFNHKIQDWIVGVEGYAKRRDYNLNLLIEQGFNKTNPTRLWLDTLICKQNFKEIKDIFIYTRENNLWPGINTLLHLGSGSNAETIKQLDVSISSIKNLFNQISRLDKEKYNYDWAPTPPYIGWYCNFYYFTMRIDNQGNVSKCLGTPIIGNVLNEKRKLKENILEMYWNSNEMKKLTNIDKNIDYFNKTYGCPCRRNLKYGEKAMFKLCPNKNIWESNI